MMIRMNEVTVYSQRDGTVLPLLNRIHTSFEASTFTLVVGQTGSGKSTLLQTLAGLMPIGKGSIRYGDHPLAPGQRRAYEAMKHAVGIAFQYPERQLFAETVHREFEYSLRPLRWTKEKSVRAIHEVLSQMNLPRDLLNEPVLALSEGTKRKIALATTFVTKPRWLLLDEPTAGMDPSGIVPLLQMLRSHREAGGGVIIASHDLDTFMPEADRVLILKNGAIEADITPQQCCEAPGLLLQAGVGWPAAIELFSELHSQGFNVSGYPVTPEAAAAAIIERLNRAGTHLDRSVQPSWTAPLPPEEPVHCTTGDDEQESIASRLDPIAKWIFYLCISAGILVQNHWPGVLLASLLSLLLVIFSRVSWRTVGGGIKFFLFFIVVSSFISGVVIGFVPFHIGFHISQALLTSRQLLRFLLVMALGIVLMATTKQRRMQLGLERVLSRLERFRFPTKLITFSAALMFRFIKMLNQETERLSLITKARGKADVKPGTVRLRDVHVFLIPLLLSMMKHAEDTAFALEARGYKVRGGVRHAGEPVRFQRRDKLTIACGLVLLIVFLIVDSYVK